MLTERNKHQTKLHPFNLRDFQKLTQPNKCLRIL